ncbi:MAG: DUF362 domain-containing protein [Acidobacteria bacterium]|nr:DUF362 domain-containing protein [Acidobacteriota bacterium]
MSRRSEQSGHGATRREFLAGSTAVLGLGLGRLVPLAGAAPAATVSVAKCDSYSSAELVRSLDRMFDQLGGLGRLVKGRTVAIKLNMTGVGGFRLGTARQGETYWVHPRVIGAVVHLLDRAGARRVRLLESAYATAMPLEEFMYKSGWEASDLARAGRRVEFENTNWLGRAREYSRFPVPGRPLLFPSYLLNHSFEDCDTFVSLAKLKEHITAGITLSMKNCFGNIPTTVYGDHVPEDEPADEPRSGREGVFHQGARQPSRPAAPEVDPASPRDAGYRIPRVVVDLCAARPVDLAVVDGIDTMSGSEGPWGLGERCHPGVLLAGTNCVNTDAVGTAIMGYDPMASRGTKPFETCDSFLELAEEAGLGSRDLSRIEVAGTPIREARFDFAPLKRGRREYRSWRPDPEEH